MPPTGKRTFARLLVVVALVLAGVALAVVGAMVAMYQLRVVQMRRMYDQLVAESEVAEYPRPAEPPGWSLEPGSAAEAYREALASCPQLSTLPRSSSTQLNLVLRAMRWDELPGNQRTPLAEPGAGLIPGECLEAGVRLDSRDRVVAQLDAPTCRVVEECDEALALLVEGSRREDARSPFALWSNWGLDPSGGSDVDLGIRFFLMVKLVIARGYLAELSGDSGAWMDASLGIVRLGGDVTRGAESYGGAIGCGMRQSGLESLRAMLLQGALTPDDAVRLRDELAYIRREPLDFGATLVGTTVCDIALTGIVREGEPVPPSVMSWLPDTETMQNRLYRARTQGQYHRIFRGMLAVQDQDHRTRHEEYEHLDQETRWGHFSVVGLASIHGISDTRFTLSNTQLELLELAAAATVMRHETGGAPASLDELEKFDPTVPRTDLFTGEPYEVTIDGDRCVVRSPAAEPARHAEVGLDELKNVDIPRRLTVTIPDHAARAPDPLAGPAIGQASPSILP